MSKENPRDYGSGSVYPRKSDGRWVGTIEAGYTESGARRRVVVTAKTEIGAKRKLREKRKKIEKDGVPSAPGRTTVKTWAAKWLDIKRATLRPKAYNAAASAVNKWIIPTIGHIRLEALTPSHIRAVAKAQRDAGRSAGTAAATHRTLLNLLRGAIVEGYSIPPGVLLIKAPAVPKSDREDIPMIDALKILAVASELPHGTRWAVALLHGMRQGECLGLTWDAVDFDADQMSLEWQLQPLPYIDRKNKALGFRVPNDFEAKHLIDAYHLVRPKSKAGVRTFPLIKPLRDALLEWREVAPVNPWGLVWPTLDGRPANNKHDLLEWHALQGTACVGHPAGRYYHVHEARNLTATQLEDLKAGDSVITSLLGHASIITSRGYMRAHDEGKRAVLEALGERLFIPND